MTEQPCEQLDPKMKTVWRIRDTATTTIIYACALFLGALFGWIDSEMWAWVIPYCIIITVLFAIALIVVLVILPPIRYARWRYELRSDFLDIAYGIIWRHRYVVPFIRVQNTDTKQGPVLRACGLASVTVSTAAGEMDIPGLRADIADAVRDRAAELARVAREDV